MILVYAGCAIVTAIVAASSVRAVRRAIRHARVARELESIHRAAYRERLGVREQL